MAGFRRSRPPHLGQARPRKAGEPHHRRGARGEALTPYLDSSALIKLYVPEAGSERVSRLARGLSQPIPFTHLHELEMKNALQLKRFRREAAANAVDASVQAMDDDLDSGVLSRPEMDWFEVFRRAGTLSREHSARIGSRSLDVLHVASALALGATSFLTFDDRQGSLARAAGLELLGR